MANNLDSNTTRKLLRKFIPAIEKQRVLSKTCNTQLFQGKFTPSSGDYVDIKRPHQYKSVRTATGDISAPPAGVPAPIISGKATATVQPYITVAIDWTNKEEALELDQLDSIINPAAVEVVTELETSFCDFIIQNAGLATGTPGTVIDAWGDIAAQGSFLKSLGVPTGEIYSVINPFIWQNLADAQTGISADPSRLVQTAWERAQIASPNFAGLRVLSSNSLSTYTSSDSALRSGTLAANPDVTYVTHKDSFQQVLSITGLTATSVLKAGDILELSGTGALARSNVHLKTGKTIFDQNNAPIPWRATVVSDVTLTGTADLVTVSGPAIYEATGAYNTVSAAPVSGDVIDVLGTASTEYQPSLFYHKDAFAIAFVKLPKLFSTDTIAVTSDGIAIRCSKYSDGAANEQTVRFDLLPAFACLNPFFSGKGFGY